MAVSFYVPLTLYHALWPLTFDHVTPKITTWIRPPPSSIFIFTMWPLIRPRIWIEQLTPWFVIVTPKNGHPSIFINFQCQTPLFLAQNMAHFYSFSAHFTHSGSFLLILCASLAHSGSFLLILCASLAHLQLLLLILTHFYSFYARVLLIITLLISIRVLGHFYSFTKFLWPGSF